MKKSKCTMSVPEILKMYRNGCNTKEISLKANVSTRYINQILKKHQVERPSHSSWLRTYSVNEDYFKNWSASMAYILGFFVADGTIPKDIQSISFSQKDRCILDKIKIEMQSTHPIIKNNKTAVHILNINSKVLKEDLMLIHGIGSNKSLNVQFPYVPNEYVSHFIRGYFDGDGNIYTRGNMVSFVGGSLLFMTKLSKVLSERDLNPYLQTTNNHYRIYISGRKTIKQFYEWIYQDKTLFLARKFNAFKDKDLNSELLNNKHLKTTKKAVQLRKDLFIKIYRETNCIKTACNQVGILIPTLKRWIKTDEVFAKEILRPKDGE
ncbi:LAGLIDADG family homing endonuclease [Fictibacillus fluitans]|uniref:LAGLIDADG family homing endonuclease n=1 Tax=Fictibacillus fluitans TaxID=3058422 RepID=A0ABT8HQI4_9BACL|nr:LAGLIDADG family homing endonuclease [Fictibacillus sp. NE201]MDN4523034.1 LAGLIDADG family homing endonuclease [Fictibacillus sp. NE201]